MSPWAWSESYDRCYIMYDLAGLMLVIPPIHGICRTGIIGQSSQTERGWPAAVDTWVTLIGRCWKLELELAVMDSNITTSPMHWPIHTGFHALASVGGRHLRRVGRGRPGFNWRHGRVGPRTETAPGSSPETDGGGAFNALSTTSNEHIRVLLAYLPTKRASQITSDRQSLMTVDRRAHNGRKTIQ